MDSVAKNKGWFVPGPDPRRNPGGMTKEQAAFRLGVQSMHVEVLEAFADLIRERNPVIVALGVKMLHGESPGAAQEVLQAARSELSPEDHLRVLEARVDERNGK